MELKSQKNGAELTVFLSGELNTLTAPELSALLDRELPGAQSLTLDFSGCDYVSSAGIRVLLATFKQLKAAKGHMCLRHVGENFTEVLENTGLDFASGVFLHRQLPSLFGGAATESAAWFLRAYAVGFVFYLLNSELAVYYKLVEAFPLAHAVFFVEALAFPLLARIALGELFGAIGFCLGGALGEIMTFGLNLCFVWRSCGHFPRRLEDCRMEPYLYRLKKAARV